MNPVRIALLALAVLLPTTWTVAKAADEPPASSGASGSGGSKSKSSKKSKKTKKSDGSTPDSDKKAGSDSDK